MRSFGIIGGGAVLFGAGAIVGQQILTVAGEVHQITIIWLILVKLFRNWIGSGIGRRGSNSCKLLASILRCADRPMLPS